MDASEMASQIAADMAPASAPLQGGGEVPSQDVEATPAPPAVSAPPPVTSTEAPATEAATADDDFSIDLDKDPEADADAPPPLETAQDDPKDKVDPDSEIGALLATPRGRRIYSAHKTMVALAGLPDADDPTKGGIGHVPSVEQVKDYYASYVDHQSMAADFVSGEPEKADTFVKHWFGRDEQGRSRPGSAEMMQRMAEVLPHVNHEAYAAFAAPAIDTFIEGMYRQAAAEADPDIKASLIKGAQVTEWWFSGGTQGGKFRDPANAAAPQQPGQPQQADPRIAHAERIIAQSQQHTQKQAAEKWTAFDTNVTTSAKKAISYDVDQALKPLKDAVHSMVYESLKDRFVAEVEKGLAQNRDGTRQFDVRKGQAKASMSEADVKELVRIRRQQASQIILAKRPEFIKAAGADLVDQSTKRHAQLQQTSQRTAPNASQVPVQRDISAALERNPGESSADYMTRKIKSDMTATAR